MPLTTISFMGGEDRKSFELSFEVTMMARAIKVHKL